MPISPPMATRAQAQNLPSGTTPAPRDSPETSGSPSAMREHCHIATLDACGDGYAVLRALRTGGTIIDWTVVDANGLVQDRWQGVVGDVVGVRLSVLDAAADNSTLWGLYGTAVHTGERQETDIELILPAGKGGWRRVTVVPIDDDTVTVLTRDITRERHFELALERSQRTLRGLAPAPARTRRASDPRISEPRLLGRSAALLFFGAGVVTIANTLLSALPGVDVSALRMTGFLSILTALFVPLLPWSRHLRFVAGGLVLVAIGYLVLSDQFDHFSRSESAVAVYPIFFIMVVAWSGLIQSAAPPPSPRVCRDWPWVAFWPKAAMDQSACSASSSPCPPRPSSVRSWHGHRGASPILSGSNLIAVFMIHSPAWPTASCSSNEPSRHWHACGAATMP